MWRPACASCWPTRTHCSAVLGPMCTAGATTTASRGAEALCEGQLKAGCELVHVNLQDHWVGGCHYLGLLCRLWWPLATDSSLCTWGAQWALEESVGAARGRRGRQGACTAAGCLWRGWWQWGGNTQGWPGGMTCCKPLAAARGCGCAAGGQRRGLGVRRRHRVRVTGGPALPMGSTHQGGALMCAFQSPVGPDCGMTSYTWHKAPLGSSVLYSLVSAQRQAGSMATPCCAHASATAHMPHACTHSRHTATT